MLKAGLLTLSAVLVSAAATAAPQTQAAAPATASGQVQMADATQTSSTATTAPAASSAVVPAEKKICKQLPSSYSRVTVRTCLTAKQWKQVDEQSRD